MESASSCVCSTDRGRGFYALLLNGTRPARNMSPDKRALLDPTRRGQPPRPTNRHWATGAAPVHPRGSGPARTHVRELCMHACSPRYHSSARSRSFHDMRDGQARQNIMSRAQHLSQTHTSIPARIHQQRNLPDRVHPPAALFLCAITVHLWHSALDTTTARPTTSTISSVLTLATLHISRAKSCRPDPPRSSPTPERYTPTQGKPQPPTHRGPGWRASRPGRGETLRSPRSGYRGMYRRAGRACER